MTQEKFSRLLKRWPEEAMAGAFRLPGRLLLIIVVLNALLALIQPGDPRLDQVPWTGWLYRIFELFPGAMSGGTLPNLLATFIFMLVPLLPWVLQFHLLQEHLVGRTQAQSETVKGYALFLLLFLGIQQIPMVLFGLSRAAFGSVFFQSRLSDHPWWSFLFRDYWELPSYAMLGIELGFLFVAIAWPYLASIGEKRPFKRSWQAAFADPLYWLTAIGIAVLATAVLVYVWHRVAIAVMVGTSLSYWLRDRGQANGPMKAIDLLYRIVRDLLSVPVMIYYIKTCQEKFLDAQPKGSQDHA